MALTTQQKLAALEDTGDVIPALRDQCPGWVFGRDAVNWYGETELPAVTLLAGAHIRICIAAGSAGELASRVMRASGAMLRAGITSSQPGASSPCPSLSAGQQGGKVTLPPEPGTE